MNADKTKLYVKKQINLFGLNQEFFQAFDFSACIGVHLRLTAFLRIIVSARHEISQAGRASYVTQS